eukprot:gene13484-19341_t
MAPASDYGHEVADAALAGTLLLQAPRFVFPVDFKRSTRRTGSQGIGEPSSLPTLRTGSQHASSLPTFGKDTGTSWVGSAEGRAEEHQQLGNSRCKSYSAPGGSIKKGSERAQDASSPKASRPPWVHPTARQKNAEESKSANSPTSLTASRALAKSFKPDAGQHTGPCFGDENVEAQAQGQGRLSSKAQAASRTLSPSRTVSPQTKLFVRSPTFPLKRPLREPLKGVNFNLRERKQGPAYNSPGGSSLESPISWSALPRQSAQSHRHLKDGNTFRGASPAPSQHQRLCHEEYASDEAQEDLYLMGKEDLLAPARTHLALMCATSSGFGASDSLHAAAHGSPRPQPNASPARRASYPGMASTGATPYPSPGQGWLPGFSQPVHSPSSGPHQRSVSAPKTLRGASPLRGAPPSRPGAQRVTWTDIASSAEAASNASKARTQPSQLDFELCSPVPTWQNGSSVLSPTASYPSRKTTHALFPSTPPFPSHGAPHQTLTFSPDHLSRNKQTDHLGVITSSAIQHRPLPSALSSLLFDNSPTDSPHKALAFGEPGPQPGHSGHAEDGTQEEQGSQAERGAKVDHGEQGERGAQGSTSQQEGDIYLPPHVLPSGTTIPHKPPPVPVVISFSLEQAICVLGVSEVELDAASGAGIHTEQDAASGAAASWVERMLGGHATLSASWGIEMPEGFDACASVRLLKLKAAKVVMRCYSTASQATWRKTSTHLRDIQIEHRQACAYELAFRLTVPRQRMKRFRTLGISDYNAAPSKHVFLLYIDKGTSAPAIGISDYNTAPLKHVYLLYLDKGTSAPAIGISDYNAPLLAQLLRKLRSKLVLTILRTLVMQRQDTTALMEHMSGDREHMQHLFSFWRDWAVYHRDLNLKLHTALSTHASSLCRLILGHWNQAAHRMLTCKSIVLQLTDKRARLWLRAWREVAGEKANQRRRGFYAHVTYLRGLAASALAHWRILHLSMKVKATWFGAVRAWGQLRLKGRVLRLWHFTSRRAAALVARASAKGKSKGTPLCFCPLVLEHLDLRRVAHKK